MPEESLIVRGAREHNLRNIDVTIPRDRLTVITGLSGSGKSSLAFDTVYAEGQRRYVESLSAYARQFLELMQKPDVDHIEGLSPAISIEQKTTSRNPRSTVGTVTALDKKLKHDIEIVVDRIAVRPDIGNRLPDSIETALNLADGLVIAEFADTKEKNGEPRRLLMSSKFACPVSGFTIPEIEPRLFSFNNPHGACPVCDGLGTQLYFDAALVVPDESLTLRKGAIAPWSKTSSPYYLQTLAALARNCKFWQAEP